MAPAAFPGTLYGVDAVSKKNVWAVGHTGDQVLIGHWNGTTWTRVPSPVAKGGLYGVSADSAADAWAVGGSLIVHWNGRSWTVSPTTGQMEKGLIAVSAVSANDVWVLGAYVWHWDGRRWTRVPTPDPGGPTLLRDISAVSATDAWLVGSYTAPGGMEQNLIERWDGTAWAVVPTDPWGDTYSRFYGVDAVSPTVAFAVGGYEFYFYLRTLVGEWDGTTWALDIGPEQLGDTQALLDVSAVSSSDMWTVGWVDAALGGLAAHYGNGDWSTWNLDGYLYGVSAVSDSNVWAVGYAASGGEYTLIEHWNGKFWTQESMTG